MYYIIRSERIQKLYKEQNGLYLGHILYTPHIEVRDKDNYLPYAYFNSGGSGYILDKYAVMKLNTVIDTPACHPEVIRPFEDVMISICLASTFPPIIPIPTQDILGEERFLPLSPMYHFTYLYPPDLETTSYKSDWWYAYHNPAINPIHRLGSQCCSNITISFHYIDWDLMHLMEEYFYICRVHL